MATFKEECGEGVLTLAARVVRFVKARAARFAFLVCLPLCERHARLAAPGGDAGIRCDYKHTTKSWSDRDNLHEELPQHRSRHGVVLVGAVTVADKTLA